MATAKFYMAYVSPKSSVSADEIVETMDLSIDWYQVNESLWILYTTSDHDKWNTRLKPLCNYFLVCKLDTSSRQGWMKKSFWKWLRRENDET